MPPSDPTKLSITDPARYEHHLSAFDLTDAEKADLVSVLYALAIEVIETDSNAVDKMGPGSLTKHFRRSDVL